MKRRNGYFQAKEIIGKITKKYELIKWWLKGPSASSREPNSNSTIVFTCWRADADKENVLAKKASNKRIK